MTIRHIIYCGALSAIAAANADAIPLYGIAQGDGPGTFAMANTGGHTGNGVGIFSDNRVLLPNNHDTHSGLTPQTANSSYTALPGNTGSAHAYAEFGIIQLSASWAHSNITGSNAAAALADGGWIDSVTIESVNPLLDGTWGILNFWQ